MNLKYTQITDRKELYNFIYTVFVLLRQKHFVLF